CLARLGFLLWPGSWFATLAAIAFAAGLAWNVVPRFLGAAKKWRNQTVAPVVVGLSLLSAGAGLALARPFASTLLHEALLLLALQMFFMGGRITAPVLSGQSRSQGISQEDHVTP